MYYSQLQRAKYPLRFLILRSIFRFTFWWSIGTGVVYALGLYLL